jgi:hypothetical protein
MQIYNFSKIANKLITYLLTSWKSINLFFRWQEYFHGGEGLQKLTLTEFKQEVSTMEFAWTSFSNSSAVLQFPDNFFEGEVSNLIYK